MINSYTLRTRARSLSFADEFPQEGVHGDDGGIYGFEGFQEFDQALGFCIVRTVLAGSLTLAIKEKRCEASKMAYFFVNFSIFFLSNV